MCLGSPRPEGRSRLESSRLHTAGAEIIAPHFVASVINSDKQASGCSASLNSPEGVSICLVNENIRS